MHLECMEMGGAQRAHQPSSHPGRYGVPIGGFLLANGNPEFHLSVVASIAVWYKSKNAAFGRGIFTPAQVQPEDFMPVENRISCWQPLMNYKPVFDHIH